MTITICGKKIEITDKNARAYEKLNLIPASADCVVCYYTATYHKNKDEIADIIRKSSEKEVGAFVNKCIEQEVRDCGGNSFYEGA